MARGPGSWLARRLAPTPPGSWTGWWWRTPRWCGSTSTAPPPAGSAGTPRPPTPTRRAIDDAEHLTAEATDTRGAVEPVIGEPGDHAIGRSRGGLTTKVHALTDGAGRVLVVLLTGGNVHDSPMFTQLMAALRVPRSAKGRPRTRPDYLLADKGYSSRANRRLLRDRGIGHTIPEKNDQAANRRRRGSAGGRPPCFDADRYARRNTVERGFCQLKQWRGLATRYDKHARNYAGALSLAALLTWLP